MGPSERASRILQGGLPLPAVFHQVLGYMLGNGRSAPGYVLTGIVRKELEDLHGPRVLTYWGSWENLTADLLEEMQEHGVVTRAGDIWTLTPKVREGTRIRLLRDSGGTDIRITPYSPEAAARRENLGYARTRAASYRLFLEEKGLFTGEIQESFQRHWEFLAWDEPEVEEEIEEAVTSYGGRKRRKGEIAEFAREYMQEVGDWVTAKEAAAAFSERYPQQDPVRPSSMWNRMQQQVWTGLAERKDGVPVPPRPGRNFTLFRWKKEEE